MVERVGSALLIVGQGVTNLAIAVAVLAELGCLYLVVRYATNGNAGASAALFFLGIPLVWWALRWASMLIALPLMLLGAKLNPVGRFVPVEFY